MEANELKVTDLMVGDLVQIKEKDGKKLVGAFRVVAIGKTYLAGVVSCFVEHGTVSISYIEDEKRVYQTNVCDIEPIPLTPEILKKNGFELDDIIKDYRLYTGIDNRVTAHNDKEYMNSNNEWYVHVDSEDFCSIANCELTYVHELQHLLRLCKIDKEIKL